MLDHTTSEVRLQRSRRSHKGICLLRLGTAIALGMIGLQMIFLDTAERTRRTGLPCRDWRERSHARSEPTYCTCTCKPVVAVALKIQSIDRRQN